ncbi:hypothetical protein ACFX15_043037 [Malus domestica]
MDCVQEDVGSGVSNIIMGNKGEMDVDVVSASQAAENNKPSPRTIVGMLSPRKRIREECANEVGTCYLEELD